jgi:hypothetical protein
VWDGVTEMKNLKEFVCLDRVPAKVCTARPAQQERRHNRLE